MCLDLAKKLGILADPVEFDSYVVADALRGQSSNTKGDEGGDDDAIEGEHDATADGTDGGKDADEFEVETFETDLQLKKGVETDGNMNTYRATECKESDEEKMGIEATAVPPQQ